MRRLRILCVTLIMLAALIPMESAFAQNAQAPDPGPEWNIQIEFRYTKGQESMLNIPNSIARYGRSYRLVGKTDPVLEKKLPATRVYTWFVDGTITEAERYLVDDIENVELIATDVEIARVVDKHETREGLPTNDVEAIELTKVYSDKVFTRAAVRFEVEGYDDFDLPVSYEAEIVYRGLEIYMGPGYEVRATYTTKEDLDGVEQYVVVATYAPDNLAPISSAGGGTGGSNDPAPAAATTANTAFEPPIDREEASIGEDLVPLASGDEDAAKPINPLLLVLLIVAIAAAGFVIWAFAARYKAKKEKEALREMRRTEALRARGLVVYDE